MVLSGHIADLVPLMEAFNRLREEVGQLREDNGKLREDNGKLREEIGQLREDNDKLQKEVEEWRKGHRVRGRRRRRSRNKTGKAKGAQGTGERKAGQKAGHPGTGRQAPTHIDRTEDCRRAACPDCQGPLNDEGVGATHTVEDLVLRVETTAYRCLDQHCPHCDKTWRAPLPPALGGAPKVGPTAQAVAMSLRFEHGVGVCAISRIFSEVFGLSFSPGGLSQMFERNMHKFAPAVTTIWTVALDEPLLHCDETGWYQDGRRAWLHAATSVNLSVFAITDRRDRDSFELLVPSSYPGAVSSDDFTIYDHLPESRHPQCWAHVLRTARDLYEIHGHASDGAALAAIGAFLRVAKVQRAKPSAAHRAAAVTAFERVLAACFWATHKKLQTLGRRLAKKRKRYLLCLDDPSIPLTNNQVERDLRFSIVARKVSYGTRNETGSLQWADGVTLGQTLRKQGQSIRSWVPPALAAAQQGLPLPPVFRNRSPPPPG